MRLASTTQELGSESYLLMWSKDAASSSPNTASPSLFSPPSSEPIPPVRNEPLRGCAKIEKPVISVGLFATSFVTSTDCPSSREGRQSHSEGRRAPWVQGSRSFSVELPTKVALGKLSRLKGTGRTQRSLEQG